MPASNLAEGHTNKERCEVSNAKELAKEIADELYKFGWIDQRWVNIYSQANLERHLERVIAAKIEPLVSDAERWKRECEHVRSIASKLDIKADDADRYERWLLEIGRAIGCQHLDEQLPNCVIQHLQGD